MLAGNCVGVKLLGFVRLILLLKKEQQLGMVPESSLVSCSSALSIRATVAAGSKWF